MLITGGFPNCEITWLRDSLPFDVDVALVERLPTSTVATQTHSFATHLSPGLQRTCGANAMTDPRVDLRNPNLAAFLAFLFPGAGHLYQRRYFKSAIYCFCILGIYFCGYSLGEAKAIHVRWDKSAEPGKPRYRSIGYFAQVGIGLPALPAVGQFLREKKQGEPHLTAGAVVESFDSDFSGRMLGWDGTISDVTGQVTGELKANQYASDVEFVGRFTGTTSDGQTIDAQLHGSRSDRSMDRDIDLELGPRVCGLDDISLIDLASEPAPAEFSADRRRFMVRMVDPNNYQEIGRIEGTVARSFFNHFQAPLSDQAMQHLHGRLGRRYELALVYTWIAGLLNILAIWDALQGPAYGYGDEVPEDESSKESDKASGDSDAAPKEAAVAQAEPPPAAEAKT